MTLQCSGALKWKECGNPKAYYKMKCVGMRARYYTWLVNNEELADCMDNMTRTMPIFKEIVEACELAFSYKSISVGILSLLLFIILLI